MQSPFDKLHTTVTGFQSASVLTSACELDLFTAILRQPSPPTAGQLADVLKVNQRALNVLLDALAALGFLQKESGLYQVAADYKSLLDSGHPDTFVPMICHIANSQRTWSQLAWTVKSGMRAPSVSSVNGPFADYRAFVLGMNSLARRVVGPLIEKMKAAGIFHFKNMLDLGGATGTFSVAFLKELHDAKATIFDLPIAIDEAKKKLADSPVMDRLSFVAGDFYVNEYPVGFDFIWISAIIHQQDAAATLEMFRQSHKALIPGGMVAIRDIYFSNPEKTEPLAAALFGVNMLANTAKGMVYAPEEVYELLRQAGFRNPRLAVPANDMTAVIVAEK